MEEINNRLIQETKNDDKKEELQYSSEESGSDAVMRRFLGEYLLVCHRCVCVLTFENQMTARSVLT